MHDSVKNWVREKVKDFSLQDKYVLEVGSQNINGTVRDLFTGKYIGIDLQEGLGVDIVMNAHSLKFLDETFDVVISTEMLEHDSIFWRSVEEMVRVLKKDGYLIITARGNGFPEHSFPNDYYRFMPESFRYLFDTNKIKTIEIIEDPQHAGVFGIGIKV